MLNARTVPTLDDLMRAAVGALDRHGHRVDPSRGPTTEVLGASFELTNPRARLSRSLSRRRFVSAIAELCWYLSGSDDVEPVQYYMDGYSENAEQDGTVHGAYGPRLFGPAPDNQVARMIDLLRKAPETRRAVIQLFDRHDLGPPRYRDVPCTCTLQFLLRDGQLELITTMRSNDVYRGLPHDVFAFTMIQELVARSVGVEPGRYIHFAGSLHRYDEDVANLRAFLSEGYQATTETMPPMPMGEPWEHVTALLAAESQLRAGVPYPQVTLPSDPYWADLVRLLARWIEARKNRDRTAADAIVGELHYDGYRAFV